MKLNSNKKTRKYKRKKGGSIGDPVIVDIWASLAGAFGGLEKNSPFKKGAKSGTGSQPDEDGTCPSMLTKIIRMVNKGTGKLAGLDVTGLSVADLKEAIKMVKEKKGSMEKEANDRLAEGEDDTESPVSETTADEAPADDATADEAPTEDDKKEETPPQTKGGYRTRKKRIIKKPIASGKSRKKKNKQRNKSMKKHRIGGAAAVAALDQAENERTENLIKNEMMNIINGYITLLDAANGQTRRIIIQNGFTTISNNHGGFFERDINDETMINKLFPLFFIQSATPADDPFNNSLTGNHNMNPNIYRSIKDKLGQLRDHIRDNKIQDYILELQKALGSQGVFLGMTDYLHPEPQNANLKKHSYHMEIIAKIGQRSSQK